MIKAILFDFDNTISDFMKWKTLATNNAARAMCKAGLKMPVKEAKQSLMKEYMKAGIESNKPFQRFLKK
ncbi:MAG: hypothetical protein QME12_00970, partial [Nanoarchaeota archaeon]|nr:hypothetical protein [Nanoarchaeota archaeon]